MDQEAPAPSGRKPTPAPAESQKDTPMSKPAGNPSAVSVTIAGVGGCGTNLARPFLSSDRVNAVKYYDTSNVNIRRDEEVFILSDVSNGSGSNRSQHAAAMERKVSQMTAEEIGEAEAAIVIFSLGGGSGSVGGLLLIREYARRGMRVIGVAVEDTSSVVKAKNTMNTLKSLNGLTKNNDIYLPIVLLSNSNAPNRGAVDKMSTLAISQIIDLLTKPVFEVDRSDRLNWINPSKGINTSPGIKLMTFASGKDIFDNTILLGMDSVAMVDSLLVLQSSDDESTEGLPALPPARLDKIGFYYEPYKRLVGKVSSDITPIEKIIDYVEKMENQDKAQKHQGVSRLDHGGDDLVF